MSKGKNAERKKYRKEKYRKFQSLRHALFLI